jgi:hypothetical protein
VLLRLAYLAATNTFALLRLLPMNDREKDIEILALRHQLLVLQRQVGKPALTGTDRALLAGLHREPGAGQPSLATFASMTSVGRSYFLPAPTAAMFHEANPGSV